MKYNQLREELASFEHEQWCQWAKGIMLTESLSPERIARWEALFCDFKDLPEKYKEKPYGYADETLKIMGKYE